MTKDAVVLSEQTSVTSAIKEPKATADKGPETKHAEAATTRCTNKTLKLFPRQLGKYQVWRAVNEPRGRMHWVNVPALRPGYAE